MPKRVSNKKKPYGEEYRLNTILSIRKLKTMRGIPIDKKSYKSNYLPNLSVKKPGKYGVDY